MSGIPDLIGDNELEYLVIKMMKAIDIEVDNRDIEACRWISKSKGDSKKAIARFCNREFSKSAFHNKKISVCQQISSWSGK